MIYKIKYNNLVAVYGSWLPAMCFGDLLKVAIRHNIPNIKYPVENYLEEVFNNIIKELDFREETDRAHSIHDDDVTVTYEMLYHNDHGLMFEGNGKTLTYISRIYLEDEND